jgi:hypothetical protein
VLAVLFCVPAVTARAEPAELATATEAATKLAFDPGHARLTGAAREALRPVANTMQAKTTLRITIVGHGESSLAKRRAEVVKWFFVDAGVESDRIDTRVNSTPGAPIELQFQGVAARREGGVVRAAPAVRTVRPLAVMHHEPAVRIESSPAHAVPTVTDLFVDTHPRRHAGVDLDVQMANARHPPVTIGSSESGSRDSGPRLAVRPLELSSVTVTVSSTPERHDDLARIRYRADEAPDAGTRAVIRAQRGTR